jgi:hypothetical protein
MICKPCFLVVILTLNPLVEILSLNSSDYFGARVG